MRKYQTLVAVCLVLLFIGGALYFFISNPVTSVKKEAVKHKVSHPTVTQVNCVPPGGSVVGILTIPKLKMVSAVEQGVEDAVINVAIGHNPATVWPGANATSELSAHDVAQFWHIDQLVRGDEIDYYSPCQSMAKFHVETAQLYATNTPVWSLPYPALILETCWPANNLGPTNERLLVTAELDSVIPNNTPPEIPNFPSPPSLAAPADLQALGLSLNQNIQEMGFMSTSGDPSPSWLQSNEPMNVEAVALETWFGLLDSAKDNNQGWWNDLAPTVSMPSQIAGQYVTEHLSRMDVNIDGTGDILSSVTLTTSLGFGSGKYSFVAEMTVSNGVMHLGSLSITPI